MKKTVRGIMGRQTVCRALLFLGLFAFQAINLDSDPSPLTEGYQFNDEGYWNHSARCRVLFGTFVPDEFNQDIIASPLFTLIQWAVFSVSGVSIYSARLLPLASLWLILLMMYFLVKRHSSVHAALLAVALLGLLHEMLMYTKWSTPIITQACFLTAILWFWEYGKTGSRWWMAACGASLVAATLTTLLTIHCLPGILLFMGVALFIRKEVDWKRIVVFLGVALFLGIVAAVAYYLPNYDQIQIFVRTIGEANFRNDPRGGVTNARQSLQALPFLELFCSPGVVPLTMLASLWFIDFLTRLVKEGIGVVLRQMSSVELYCVCWVVGATPSIIATPTIAPRRFVIFLVPIAVLSSFFIWRVWNARFVTREGDRSMFSADRLSAKCGFPPKNGPVPNQGVNGYPSPEVAGRGGWWRIAFWCLIAAAWCECVWMCDLILHCRWLVLAGLGISSAITTLVCVLCVVLAGLYFLSRKTKATIVLLLICFFAVNLGLTGIWYSYATYTFRDTSRELRNNTVAGDYLLGHFACELALENKMLPVYPPWGRHRMKMNAWFVEESNRVSFLASDNGKGELVDQFPSERVSEIRQIRLFPVIFSENEYIYKGALYVVRPPVSAASGSNSSPGSQRGRPMTQEAGK
jgi:hypothetical protein